MHRHRSTGDSVVQPLKTGAKYYHTPYGAG